MRLRLFPAFLSLIFLGACALTEVLPVKCRHEALLCSAVMVEKHPVRIVVGTTKVGLHAQAQAFIDREWRWLQTDGKNVFVGTQEQPMDTMQVYSFFEGSRVWFSFERGKAAAPTLRQIYDPVVIQGEQLEFTVKGAEIDWPDLSYTASNLPPGASFDPVTGAFSWVPGPDQIGIHKDVQFTVVDKSLPIPPVVESITISVVPRPKRNDPAEGLPVKAAQEYSQGSSKTALP